MYYCVQKSEWSLPGLDYFERISHNIGTRNNGLLLRVLRIKLEGTKMAFFYNGTILFNKLPIEVWYENNFMRKFYEETATILYLDFLIQIIYTVFNYL